MIIYPGRASRMKDQLVTNLKDYIEGLDQGLVPFIDRPCFFIGHRYLNRFVFSKI